jgi:hypothetical protein
MWHEWGGGGSRRAYRFWYGNLSKTDHLEDLDIDGRIILIMDLQERRLGRGLH